jgi:hypothetical protein
VPLIQAPQRIWIVPLILQNGTRCNKRSPSGRKRFSRSGRIKSQASVLTIKTSMSWHVVHTSTTRSARSLKPAHHWQASAGPPPGRPTPLSRSRVMNKQTAALSNDQIVTNKSRTPERTRFRYAMPFASSADRTNTVGAAIVPAHPQTLGHRSQLRDLNIDPRPPPG